MKLKTLKDFEEQPKEHEWGEGNHEEDCVACERNKTLEKLKQEAIKWVKEMNMDKYENNLWKAFFNISEDDLKGGLENDRN